MHVLIIGGGGMIGRKLSDRLARDGQLKGREIARLTLHDVVEPAVPAGAPFATDTAVSDLSVPGAAEALVADRPEVVIHLGDQGRQMFVEAHPPCPYGAAP